MCCQSHVGQGDSLRTGMTPPPWLGSGSFDCADRSAHTPRVLCPTFPCNCLGRLHKGLPWFCDAAQNPWTGQSNHTWTTFLSILRRKRLSYACLRPSERPKSSSHSQGHPAPIAPV